jgi:O-antigen/teichoic acid export membrane protein
VLLLFHIIQQKEWHIKPIRGFISKELRKEMTQLGIYSLLAGGAGAIILNVDIIMVNQLLDEKQTGIYGIAFYFGTIILIPARSIYRITASIVAENFKQNKLLEIHKLYKQSCNTQLAIGILLFIGIWANINNIVQLLPAEYASGKNVILILTMGYLVEMATGINQVIIAASPQYKYDTYFVFILVFVTVIANYILIPIYGIEGSALATAIVAIFGNGLRYGLLYKKYGMQPFTKNTLKIIIIAVIAFIPGYFIPTIKNWYFDTAIRSSMIGGVFIFLLLKLEAAPELNNKIRKNLKHIPIVSKWKL